MEKRQRIEEALKGRIERVHKIVSISSLVGL